MANVIPMAGLGSRFSKEGYTTPKPLISVSGVPMIIQAIRTMPASDKWIFIVRQEHISDHKLDEIIKQEIPDAIIIAVNKTTLGIASTALLAQAYLKPDEPVFIAACDNGYVFNKEKFQQITINPTIDAAYWTFTKMGKMRETPTSYSWIRLSDDGITIQETSVKMPVSDDPFYDHATTGSYYFKRSSDFIEATHLMIKENAQNKSEYYIDALPSFLKRLGKRSVIFDVDQWICWGTPKELKEYEGWESFFKEDQQFDEGIHNKEQYLFWRKYFKGD